MLTMQYGKVDDLQIVFRSLEEQIEIAEGLEPAKYDRFEAIISETGRRAAQPVG
jgi:hypothetical protein